MYLPKSFGNFVPILFGLGAIAIVKFPEGTLTMQARQFRGIMTGVRTVNESLYQAIKIGAAAYSLVFIALIVAVKDLWWLWIAITFVVLNFGVGYLAVMTRKHKPAAAELLPPETVLDGLPSREPVHGLSGG